MNRRITTLLFLALTCTASSAFAQDDPPGGERPRRGGGGFTVERFMEQDVNGDGKLSRDELPERFAERMFDSADANSDGFIDASELETFFASRGAGRQRGGNRRGGQNPRSAEVTFSSQMFAAGRSIRRLGRSAFDAETREEDFENLDALQTALIRAKSRIRTVEMSEAATAKYGEDKSAYHKAFRLQLLLAIGETLSLEHAILKGDTVAAKASLEKLVAVRNQGHGVFQPDEEHREQRGRRRGAPREL